MSFPFASGLEGAWRHFVNIEPGLLLKHRQRQKMALARYGRQSLLQWEDVSVLEIRDHFNSLMELLNAEQGKAGSEDR